MRQKPLDRENAWNAKSTKGRESRENPPFAAIVVQILSRVS